MVMLTRLTEGGKSKCAAYWPDGGGTVVHGGITVRSVSTARRKSGDYLVTELEVTVAGATRSVKHFWFDGWPDYGVPEGSSHGLIDLILEVEAEIEKNMQVALCPTRHHRPFAHKYGRPSFRPASASNVLWRQSIVSHSCPERVSCQSAKAEMKRLPLSPARRVPFLLWVLPRRSCHA